MIFQICKSQVLTSFSSVVSSVRESALAEPIHPHLLSSDFSPVLAFPGNTVWISAAIAATLVPTPLISNIAASVGAALSLWVSTFNGNLPPVKINSWIAAAPSILPPVSIVFWYIAYNQLFAHYMIRQQSP